MALRVIIPKLSDNDSCRALTVMAGLDPAIRSQAEWVNAIDEPWYKSSAARSPETFLLRELHAPFLLLRAKAKNQHSRYAPAIVHDAGWAERATGRV